MTGSLGKVWGNPEGGVMDGRTEEQKGKRTEERKDKRIEGQKDRRTKG